MWRDIFSYSSNPEVFLDADNVRSLLPSCPQDGLDVAQGLALLRASSVQATEKWKSELPDAESDAHAEVLRTLIEQTAPMAAAAGAALQGLSAPGVFEDPPNLRLMALLADDLGAGAAERWRFDRFRDIARDHGLTSITGSLKELSNQRSIRDGCFRLPALIYAMSRRSDAFDCELIGLDLAWRTMGLLPAWKMPSRTDDRWVNLDLGRGRGAAMDVGTDLAAHEIEIVNSIGQDPEARMRIAHGIALYNTLFADLDALLFAIVRSMRNPRLAMAILVQDRAREARVYHGDFMLEGRALSDWFEAAQNDPMPLVDALGRSKLVRPDKPERSLLISGLLREDGMMFRIFTSSDVSIIHRWIESLKDGADSVDAAADLPAQVRLRHDYRKVCGGDLGLGTRPSDIRSAYHLLQGRALHPRTRQFAHDYCAFWLEQSQESVDKSDRSLPREWRPGELREWLLASHDSHADAYESSKDQEVPDRSTIVDQTLQLAPLTLIDGAWIQGFTEASLAASRVGAALFETYWDELGNGQWKINHPKIYRDVLAAMDIALPPTGSRAFANDKRLREASFRLPVYWLCLGKQPISLRPEILGMNLAMELSGVGGAYRNARKSLKHYGFPTTFVDLHNTIDNVSTGHSAWAADAINAYMQTTQELIPADQSWARIRLGYESLAPIVDDPENLDFFARTSPEAKARQARAPLLHHPLAPGSC